MYYGIKLKPSVQYKTVKYEKEAFSSKEIVCTDAEDNGTLWVGTDCGLFCLTQKNTIIRVQGICGRVTAVICQQDTVFACANGKVYTVKNNEIMNTKELSSNGVAFCKGLNGTVWLADAFWLYRLQNGEFVMYSDMVYQNTTALAATFGEQVYAASEHGLLLLHGKRPSWENALPELCNVPEVHILSLKADALGYLWVGTDKGLYLFDGKIEWKTPDCFDFIPQCPITSITFGKNGELYLGTTVGMYVVTAEKTRFFGNGRYLCSEQVLSVAVPQETDRMFVATPEGISKILLETMSLAQKEAYYQSLMPCFTREGFVTMVENAFHGWIESGKPAITDNDGFWTADYVIAQSFKYAVTGDEKDRELAQISMKALLKLETMTGIPGFPARAYRRPGEEGFGDGDPEWHLTEDEKGKLEWKGETSSDELCGHFGAAAAYYDFCADETEKSEIANAIGSIMNHIIENGWCLCDTDGLPTTWAHFGPDDLNHSLAWCWEKGVNSLEILSFLSTSYHITGNELFLRKKEELLKKHHYALNLTTHKVMDEHSVHIDDRLAYYALLPLLWYEDSPAVKRYLALATRRHYEYELEEGCPFYIFVTALLSNGHTVLHTAVQSLEEYPLDLYSYDMKNSIRPDVRINTGSEKYGFHRQSLHALPYSERIDGDMCYNAYGLDRKSRKSYMSPALWLLSYWMGRYYGMLEE